MVNEAALLAARKNKPTVTQDDFEEAKDRVMMGPERRSLILTDDDKKTTAIHEMGHALCAKMLPDSDPVHKVTIIPRGRALGVTSILPGEERKHMTRRRLKSYLVYALGGRAAEEIILGEYTTGAADDLRKATSLAHRMICEFGMSEHLGPRTFGDPEGQIFLGRELAQGRDYSDETARKIDEEVQAFIVEAHDAAGKILRENHALLVRISDVLIERETLSGEEFELLIAGKELPPLQKSPTLAPPPDSEAKKPAGGEIPKPEIDAPPFKQPNPWEIPS
jgi:cell division protease FtsH